MSSSWRTLHNLIASIHDISETSIRTEKILTGPRFAIAKKFHITNHPPPALGPLRPMRAPLPLASNPGRPLPGARKIEFAQSCERLIGSPSASSKRRIDQSLSQ
jgi:hypothetical protein